MRHMPLASGMTILEKFGQRVKELRLAKELSREKLGPFNKTACHCEAFSRKKIN